MFHKNNPVITGVVVMVLIPWLLTGLTAGGLLGIVPLSIYVLMLAYMFILAAFKLYSPEVDNTNQIWLNQLGTVMAVMAIAYFPVLLVLLLSEAILVSTVFILSLVFFLFSALENK